MNHIARLIYLCVAVALMVLPLQNTIAAKSSSVKSPLPAPIISSPLAVKPITINLPPVDSVVVHGHLNVQIISQQPQTRVVVNGPAQSVDVSVRHNTLFIAPRHEWSNPATSVNVWVPRLLLLSSYGDSAIRVSQLSAAAPLSLMLAGSCRVSLEGMVNLEQVLDESEGTFTAHWINSPFLSITASGQAQIKLAGRVRILQADLTSESSLDAPYLRADDVYVKTFDAAIARVLALNNLNAFATDQSNIYSYKVSKHSTIDTKQSSNVLQLAYWN